MPIQLDKILSDIAEEKPLHPHSEAAKSKKEQDDAWIKVGKKNKLSAHEAKSIFKVLQKKYEQEKMKPSSSWKLFNQMEHICRKEEAKIEPKQEEETNDQEEESMVEFLEVREEDDDYEGDSDNQDRSMRSTSSTGSPEKEATTNVEIKQEPKVLNTNSIVSQPSSLLKPDYGAASNQQNQQQPKQSAFSRALQNKGISVRKTTGLIVKPTTLNKTTKPSAPDNYTLTKRKMQNNELHTEDAIPSKKINVGTLQTAPTHVTSQIPEIEIKKEAIDEMEAMLPTTTLTSREGINVITIPSHNQTITRELSNGITTIKSNGFNTQIEELDFQKDIIFDNPSVGSKSCQPSAAPGEIINIGNFDNQLPPTFFKNLCNSNRHEALGLYVANVMNRVTGKTAARLEINILKSIIEAQSDELTKL